MFAEVFEIELEVFHLAELTHLRIPTPLVLKVSPYILAVHLMVLISASFIVFGFCHFQARLMRFKALSKTAETKFEI